MNGGVGLRRRSFRSTLVTVQSAPRRARRRTSSTRALLSRRSFLWSSLLPVDLGEPRGERRRRAALEPRLDRPVLLGHEGADLALALADDAHRDRLHAPGREPAADLLPEERAELVADEPVEDAARLLRVEAVLVELARVLRAPRAPPSS